MSATVLLPEPRSDRVRIMNLNDSLHLYLGDLERQGKKQRTIQRYATFLGKLADMYPFYDVDEITVDMVRRYLDLISRRVDKPSEVLDQDTISQRVGIIKNFFKWLRVEGKIPADPSERLVPPKRKNPIENDNVVTVTTEEAQRMLAVAARDLGLERDPRDRYRKLLCLAALAYTGGRRQAISDLLISDYDGFAEPPTLTFHEKGGKLIRKPVAAKFAEIVRAAHLDGVWESPEDYLIPSRAAVRNKGKRDPRIIYAMVKEVAADAKVNSHVHALRAAFAVYFIDTKPEQFLALKDLMGHADPATTMIYLRRRNRQKNMGTVVDLDWGDMEDAATFEASPVTEKEGFEPSFRTNPVPERDGLPREDA